MATAKLYDLRSEQTDPPKVPHKFRIIRNRVARRDPKTVTGITIHQTATDFSVAQFQINEAGGDRELALARRALNVACHVMSFRNGMVVWANPLDWYVYHGNGFNSTDLGIEIEGNYPGLIGGVTWNKKTPTILTQTSISAAKAGLKLLLEEGRKAGMPIRYINAHRQSSGTRRADPGEEIWKKIVLEYAVPVLKLQTRPALFVGKGKPVPVEWDPDGVGSY